MQKTKIAIMAAMMLIYAVSIPAATKTDPGKKLKKHNLTIQAKKIGNRKYEVKINSDLPKGVTLYLWVYRKYIAPGNIESIKRTLTVNRARYGDFISKDIHFTGKEHKEIVIIDDMKWFKAHLKKMVEQDIKKNLDSLPRKVHDSVTFSIYFYPEVNKEFSHIFGEKGERLDGNGVLKEDDYYYQKNELSIKVPVLFKPFVFKPVEIVSEF